MLSSKINDDFEIRNSGVTLEQSSNYIGVARGLHLGLVLVGMSFATQNNMSIQQFAVFIYFGL